MQKRLRIYADLKTGHIVVIQDNDTPLYVYPDKPSTETHGGIDPVSYGTTLSDWYTDITPIAWRD